MKNQTKVKVSEAKFNTLVDDMIQIINETKAQCGIKLTVNERNTTKEHALQKVAKSHYFGRVGNFNYFTKEDQELISKIDAFIIECKNQSKTNLTCYDDKGSQLGFGRYINKTGKLQQMNAAKWHDLQAKIKKSENKK